MKITLPHNALGNILRTPTVGRQQVVICYVVYHLVVAAVVKQFLGYLSVYVIVRH